MKKTILTTALLLALGNAQAATLDANAEYDFTINTTGSCFAFGDCTALVDNVTAGAVISISTTDDGAGGVNFTVTSATDMSYTGTPGGLFSMTKIGGSGSVDIDGNTSYTPTGRLGAAEFFGYLGTPAWNINDTTAPNGSQATYSSFTSGSMMNYNFSDANGDGTETWNPELTLTGTVLDSSLNANIVSVENIGTAWGSFVNTPYSEVWAISFTKTNSGPISQDDTISIDQGTTSYTISVMADNGNGVDNDPAPNTAILSISSVSATTNGGTATISSTDIIYDAPALPAGVTIQSDSFTYTITDGTLNSTATVSINLADITAPLITLNGTTPTNIILGNPYNEPEANCSDNFDTDKNATIAGDVVDVNVEGTYVLTYNCSDAATNAAAQVTRTVIISAADQPPVISVTGADPLDVPVTPDNSNSFTQAIANADVSCTDDLDTPVLTNNADTVVDTSSLGGPFTITYDCVDSGPLSATSVTRDINVIDNVSPVVTPTGSNPTNIVVGNAYVEQGATCTDNVDTNPTIGSSPAADTIDTSTIGNTATITYTCTDASGNSDTATIEVVTISTGPVITLNGDTPVSLFIGQTYIEEGADCNDDVDARKEAIMSGDTVDTSAESTFTINYNCSDSDGNNATEVTRTVTVIVDTEAPVITLNDEATIELNLGFTYLEQGAVCSDNADADKAADVSGDDAVDTSLAGTYTVSYSCTDSADHVATIVTRTVTVKEVNPSDTTTENSDVEDEIGGFSWWVLASIFGLMVARRRKA